jgi:hypothetical protein
MADRTLKIVVTKGPAAGSEAVLAGRGLTIGRDSSADLVLSEDEFVSPQHARIVWSDRGAMLRNQSPNGTLVNGRSVSEAALTSGDTIAVGLLHLLTVRAINGVPTPGPSAAPAATVPNSTASTAASTEPGAAAAWPNVPTWLVAYLALMLVAFVFFGAMKVRGSSQPLLPDIERQEQEYASTRHYPDGDTARVMRLLDTGAVHERRGDTRSAYEVYRELLSVRQPVDPRAPAYLYAASRMAALGPR